MRTPVVCYKTNGIVFDTRSSALLARGSLAETWQTEAGRVHLWLYRTQEGDCFAVSIRSGAGALCVYPLPDCMAHAVYQACGEKMREFYGVV